MRRGTATPLGLLGEGQGLILGKKMREVNGDLPGMWVREAGGLSAPMSCSTGVDDLAG